MTQAWDNRQRLSQALGRFSLTEEHMPNENEEKKKVSARKDRDILVFKLLRQHPEWTPASVSFDAGLPRDTIEPLRQGMIEAGWVEYGKTMPERSPLPSSCLRASLKRLRKKNQLTWPGPVADAVGSKKVKLKQAAFTKALTKVIKEDRVLDRHAFIIEAARTGLKVRLLVDGTIEVSP